MYTFTLLYDEIETQHTVRWWWQWRHPAPTTWSNFIKYSRLSRKTKRLLERLTEVEKHGLLTDYYRAGRHLEPVGWNAKVNRATYKTWGTEPHIVFNKGRK